MDIGEQIKRLLASANDLLARAKDDPALAEALLADPAAEIGRAAGHSVPEGMLVSAARGEDGAIALAVQADPAFEGELDDALLSEVAAGLGWRGLWKNRSMGDRR
jgi:hypothetical protein